MRGRRVISHFCSVTWTVVALQLVLLATRWHTCSSAVAVAERLENDPVSPRVNARTQMSAADAAAELAASPQRWFPRNSTSFVQSVRDASTHEFVSWNGDQQPRSSSSSSFVQTRGKQFVLNGRPMYVNGANFYWLMTAAANPYTRSQVTQVLQEAASVGLTVGRAWAFNDGVGYETLQSSPGVFNEYVFRGLDFAVAEAKRFGIRLILSLVNGNPTWGGKQQYVNWAQEYAGIYLPDEDSFFTDPTIMSWYKNFVKVNSIASLASCSIS
jgi:hypothetical protein